MEKAAGERERCGGTGVRWYVLWESSLALAVSGLSGLPPLGSVKMAISSSAWMVPLLSLSNT